jgi:insulysin
MVFCFYTYAIAALLALMVCPTVAQDSATGSATASTVSISKVIKSENDTRDYRYLTLGNGLKVLLISDMSTKKSAAALNVNIGSHQNPKQRPGLAHFLEHMLLSSSEKYPRVNEYKEFVAQRGGHLDSYTAAEHSRYFFEIENAYLEQALARFAQFFVAPLFDVNAVERERNTVYAEYLANINDDDKRIWDVYRSVFNAEHPAANFSIGNLEALADRQGHSLREDLLSFYHGYYSANLMSLTIMSNQRLDALQKIVEAQFSSIPNYNKIVSDVYPSLFQQDILPLSISIKPIHERRELSFLFPIPHYSNNSSVKPWEYFASVLNSEASGSLLSLLKSLDWADALAAREVLESRREGLFQISISLTKEGARAKDQIISSVFDALNTLTEKGINPWRFNELKQLAELDFRFQERLPALATVKELVQNMQEYPAAEVLRGSYSLTQYDDALLKKAASYLNKNNVLIALVAPEANVSSVTSFYQTPYGYTAGIPEILPLKPIYHQKILLPEPNVFIPKNTAVKARSLLPEQNNLPQRNVPSRLMDNDNFVLWFLQDQYFRSPKAELNFRFKLPSLNNSVDGAAKMELFSVLLLDKLNEYLYPAELAGLRFSMVPHSSGFDIAVAGYTDKQNLLVNKILSELTDPVFTEARFKKLKVVLVKKLRSANKELPYQSLVDAIPRLQHLPYWEPKEYADVLEVVRFDDFEKFSGQLLRGVKIEALFYGNLYAQDAIKLGAIIEHQLLQKKSNRLPQLTKIIRSENKNNKSWLYSPASMHKDRAVALYLQAPSSAVEDTAHMLLLGQMIKPVFAKRMRVDKQPNDVIELLSMPLKTFQGLAFVVQSSETGAEEIVAKINTFLTAMPSNLTDDFVAARDSLVAKLSEVPKSQAEQSEQYWKSILFNDKDFLRRHHLMDAVNKITPDSLRVFYESVCLQKNRRLWLSTSQLDMPNDFETITNVSDYQQKQQGYLYP